MKILLTQKEGREVEVIVLRLNHMTLFQAVAEEDWHMPNFVSIINPILFSDHIIMVHVVSVRDGLKYAILWLQVFN